MNTPSTHRFHPLETVSQQPVSLKSLSVDAKGKLARRRTVGPLGFQFKHGGLSYDCRFYERTGQAGLTMVAPLGKMPQGDKRRADRVAVRTISKKARMSGISVIIRRNGQVDVEFKIRPQIPVTGSALLSHLTWMVLVLDPWIALIRRHLRK